ncbi:hypothetical protein [Pectobacterium carotovorum]|uniref:hypothetical protein n=1 Tax=Pectobacterium carotovorum TaxID=554 RepID=UPI001E3E2333|nr:hypothetical protein [Pectobacterium carotovorum]UFT94946.1 hypothetical protein LQF52_02640 [Pectobacterium carotovorum]
MSLEGNRYIESRDTWIPRHGYVLMLKVDRLGELEEDLVGNSICSQAIPKIPMAMRRKPMLCFLSAKRGYLTHVARSIVYYGAESGKDKLDMWHLTKLTKPVSMVHIRKKIEGKQGWRARKAIMGGHVSSAAFDLIMAALLQADPDAAKFAEGLINRVSLPLDTAPNNAKINWAYQRDAVVTSLEIAGIPKDLLKINPQLDGNSSNELTSIFDTDESVTTIEDLAILQDLDNTSEEWSFVKRQHYPAKTFINGDTALTVILANKLPLEVQLGVDLVYVNETMKSVVFVQYKMFSGADGENGYRPDGQLAKEIKRMDVVAATLAGVATDESCDGYRFGSDPFFLKFCSKLLSHDTGSHVPGMYIPVSYWKRLLKSVTGKGKKGGTIVYADTFGKRYFTPTHFVDMVTRGWAGTSALQADVLVPYLKDMMTGKKGIVLAIKSSVPADPVEDDEDESASTHNRVNKYKKPKYPGKKPKTTRI